MQIRTWKAVARTLVVVIVAGFTTVAGLSAAPDEGTPRDVAPNVSLINSCVLCDGCLSSMDNHVTAGGGSRAGDIHSCFTATTCFAHNFISTCSGGGEDPEGEEPEPVEIPWSELAEATGAELTAILREYPDRWLVNQARGAMQWKDCDGNIVASIPLADGQLLAAVSAMRMLGAENIGAENQ